MLTHKIRTSIFSLFTVMAIPIVHLPAARGQIVEFVFSKPGKPPVTMRASFFSEDVSQTLVEKTLSVEAEFYPGTGYEIVADHTNIHGFDIGKNVPTRRQNCAGLSLARVIGGPYCVDPGAAFDILKAFGTSGGAPNVGDLAVWATGHQRENTKHVGIVARVNYGTEFPVWVYSKDTWERVYLGPAITFPERKGFGQVTYWAVDWNEIDVYRPDDDEEWEKRIPSPQGTDRLRGRVRPRYRKALIEAANKIVNTCQLPEYVLDGSLNWTIETKQVGGEFTAEYRDIYNLFDFLPEKTADDAKNRFEEIRKNWSASDSPEKKGEDIVVQESPGCMRVYQIHELDVMAEVCAHWDRWTVHGSVSIAARRAPGEWPTAEQIQAARLKSKEHALYMVEAMIESFRQNELDKPERPLTNYPREKNP